MLMLATYPASDVRLRPGQPKGFTLLELIVVLALLGLATALVAPSGFRMISSWHRATDLEASLQTVSALSVAAASEGRMRMLETGSVDADLLSGMPEGWRIELDAPLTVQANGACSDSLGRALGPDGHVQKFEVIAPFCRVKRVDDSP